MQDEFHMINMPPHKCPKCTQVWLSNIKYTVKCLNVTFAPLVSPWFCCQLQPYHWQFAIVSLKIAGSKLQFDIWMIVSDREPDFVFPCRTLPPEAAALPSHCGC